MAKALIIEQPDIGGILSFILQEDGFETVLITSANSIEEVLKETPDIIIVHARNNHQLPGMELIKILKRDARTKDISVILTSTHENIKQLARDCGADGYIAKPFEMSYVLNLVKTLTR